MKITTAWAGDEGGRWLVAAFDHANEEYLGERPDAYTEAIDRASVTNDIRELVLNVPDSAIESLFTTPEVEASVECIDCGKVGTHRVCADCFAGLGEGS